MGTEPVADMFTGRYDVPDVAVSPVRLMAVWQPCIMKGISVIRTVGRLRIVRGILGRTGVTAFRNGYGAFTPDTDDPLPPVVFSGKLFSDEDIADMPVRIMRICRIGLFGLITS